MAPPHRPHHESVESRRSQRHQRKIVAKRRRTIIVISTAVVIALVAAAVILAVRDDEAETDPRALLILNDYSITGSLIVEAGDQTFVVANVGSVTHNVGVRNGPITADLVPEQGGRLELRGLQPGMYELYCDITGHVERGMVATLQVVEPGGVPVVPTA